MNLVIPNKVVPGFPYEGALLWFFSGRDGHSYTGKHPYYVTLYGPGHQEMVPRATALSALFENIIFASADAQLPDFQSCIKGDVYEHRDLRIRMSWSDNEWDYKKISSELLKMEEIDSLVSQLSLFRDDHRLKEQFICRTILQLRLAQQTDSVLIGDNYFHLVCEKVLKHLGDSIQSQVEMTKNQWILEPKTLDTFALNLPSNSIDAFASIRQSKEISNYSNDFRNAVHASIEGQGDASACVDLMREAMEQDEIRQRAAGAFQAAGSGANIGGLIPFVGTIASGISIASDAASRALEASSIEKQWYLLGPKMQEVALKGLLKKRDAQQVSEGDA